MHDHPVSSVPSTRPIVVTNPLSGEVRVLLGTAHAGQHYTVGIAYDRAEPGGTMAVQIDPMLTDATAVPAVLYGAINHLWALREGAQDRQGSDDARQWELAHIAISRYRVGWLEALASEAVSPTLLSEGRLLLALLPQRRRPSRTPLARVPR